MIHGKNKATFALFCLVTTIIEEATLIAVLLWLLPHFGITIPIWLFTVLVLAWGAWSYLTYRLGKSAIGKTPAVGPEAMIGAVCQTITPLCPKGQVQTGTELWRAYSIVGDIDAGVEVVIIGMKGLTLFVTLSSGAATNNPLGWLSGGTGNHDGLPYNRFGQVSGAQRRQVLDSF